jgi:serine/threonine protein phosphatase PrpC
MENSTLVLGVFDGHGRFGHDCSNFVHTFLPTAILADPVFDTDPEAAIMKAFLMTHIGLVMDTESEDVKYDCVMSGTTATVAVIRGKTLWIAYVGDSRAVLGINIKGKRIGRPATYDHKPNIPGEKARITKAGGSVRKDADDVFYRVYQKGKMFPGLNMSRAFGDLLAGTIGVSHEPDMTEITLDPSMEFILICSDGVWEFISNNEAV